MQDLLFLMPPSSVTTKNPDYISWKAANMFLNRFTIDEDAAFELLGVAHEREGNQLLLNKIDDTHSLHIICAHGLQDNRLYMPNVIFENNQAKSVLVTMMYMCRSFLITKERMEDICKGKGMFKESVNDDIEALFEDIQLGNKLKTCSCTYFLPKLTHKEKELVEKKDSNYLKTFFEDKPTIDDEEMRSSESKSMYVRGLCTRETYKMENPMLLDEDVRNVLPNQISVVITSLESNLGDDDFEKKSQNQQKCYNNI